MLKQQDRVIGRRSKQRILQEIEARQTKAAMMVGLISSGSVSNVTSIIARTKR